MKRHLFYTFLCIFVATAVVTLLGITQLIKIEDKYLAPLFGALLIELVGAVIAMYRGVNFFDEDKIDLNAPDNTTHSDEIKVLNDDKLSTKPTDIAQDSVSDLEDFFLKLENLSERFRERAILKNEMNGKLVLYTGVVNHVSDSYGGAQIFTNSKSGKTVFINLPASKEADVYSLRKGDIVKVCGIVDTGLESSATINSETFERIQQESSNKVNPADRQATPGSG